MYKIITTLFILLSGHRLNLFLHLKATEKNSVFVLEKSGADLFSTVVSVTFQSVLLKNKTKHFVLTR